MSLSNSLTPGPRRNKIPIMKNILLFVATAILLVAGFGALSSARAAAVDPNGEVWFQRCNEEPKGKEPRRGKCEIFQRLIHNESGARILEFAIGYPPNKTAARGIISLPLGILLQKDMLIKIDELPPFGFKVRYCDPNGCYAYLNLDEAVLEKLRKGTKITVIFESMKPQKVEVELSLKGFAKALKQVS